MSRNETNVSKSISKYSPNPVHRYTKMVDNTLWFLHVAVSSQPALHFNRVHSNRSQTICSIVRMLKFLSKICKMFRICPLDSFKQLLCRRISSKCSSKLATQIESLTLICRPWIEDHMKKGWELPKIVLTTKSSRPYFCKSSLLEGLKRIGKAGV